MTNGEKIIAILKPRKDQIRIYDNWVEIEIQKLGINFSCELDWWNTECNEPTRIDLRVDAISRQAVIDELKRYFHDEYYQRASIQDCRNCFIEDVLNHLPSVTPQEPILEKDGTLIVTTEHCEKVGRVLVQYGTNGTLFYQDQEPIKPMVEIDLYSVIKQKYIEREVLDEIRAEIEEQVLESLSDGGDDWFTAEKVNECLDIIDKYRTESEGEYGD